MLCLCGYLSNKESFLSQIEFFSRFFRVVVPDLSGFGENPEMKFPYSLDDYVDETYGLLNKLGIKKYDMLAHSFGARVAIRLAQKDERADKIVFTGAAGLKPRRGLKYLLRRASFFILKKFVKREKLTFLYSKDYRNLSPVMKESFKKIISETLDEEVGRLQNRALVISGTKDKETPISSQKKLAKKLKNASFEKMNGLGHFCFVERADEFNGKVFKFLTEG